MKSIKNNFKIGDRVCIKQEYLPVTDNWLGEGNRITHKGPYTIQSIDKGFRNYFIDKLDNINVRLRFSRFEHYNEFLEIYQIY